jgi:hypothetical protein
MDKIKPARMTFFKLNLSEIHPKGSPNRARAILPELFIRPICGASAPKLGCIG